jgi:hypothetical protein
MKRKKKKRELGQAHSELGCAAPGNRPLFVLAGSPNTLCVSIFFPSLTDVTHERSS